jgi:hypothetical protein
VGLDEAVAYRMAYGLARALIEADAANIPGRWRSNRAAGGAAEAILAEVIRRLGMEQGADEPVVTEGVRDAFEGRRPAW